MRSFLVNTIRVFHALLVLVVLLGWMYPNNDWLRAYIVGLGFVVVQWWLLDNRCILTIVEYWILEQSCFRKTAEPDSFIGRIAQKLTGKRPSEAAVNVIAYGCAILCGILAYVRMGAGL